MTFISRHYERKFVCMALLIVLLALSKTKKKRMMEKRMSKSINLTLRRFRFHHPMLF